MATPNRGFGATLGIGEESSWGTAVSRTNWLRLRSSSVHRRRELVINDHLGVYGAASTNPRESFVASDHVGGDISWIMGYDDSTVLLMEHLLGAKADDGGGPYTHTMTLASPVPLNGLTLEIIRATAGSGGGDTAEVFEGCYLSQGTIEVSAGGLMTCTAGVIGQTSGGLATAGSPTYSSNGEAIKHNHAGQLGFNSNSFYIRSLSLNIERGMERNQELGSLFTQEPSENRLAITWDVELMWRDNNLYTDFLAETASDLTISFTGTGNNALAFTGHNAKLVDMDFPTSAANAVPIRAQFRSFADSSDTGLTMVFTNDNATGEAN